MIEVNLTFNFYRDINEEAYSEWAKKAIVVLLKSPGIIEFKSNRNMAGTPEVKYISTWKSLVDWAAFFESEKWTEMTAELEKYFATDLNLSLWIPSPIAPGPLHPSK